MFWQVGSRVNDFVLNNQRAEYGKQLVVTLSRQLRLKYGNNFEEKLHIALKEAKERIERKKLM